MGIDKLYALRPENFVKRFGKNSRVLVLSGKDILDAIYDEKVIVMAANTRIKHVIPGIMRAAKELDAVVAFELAKSECDLNGGYTGFTPYTYAETVVEYAEKVGFLDHPFFIHADHTTVKNTSEKEIETARELLKACYEAGYSSYAIDASFNELEDNIRITLDLAKPYDELGLGIEVEVGEIKSAGQEAEITTVEEAVTFISALADGGLTPDFLAINNGSKHGNYLEGEKIFIDLDRTGEIAAAIDRWHVRIAQHGTTGTPLHLIGRFADYGIRKANVGTHWQNIAHEHLPPELMKQMREWAEKEGKNIKYATKQFLKEINSIPEENKKAIEEHAYEDAKKFIEAFRAKGTASLVKKKLLEKL